MAVENINSKLKDINKIIEQIKPLLSSITRDNTRFLQRGHNEISFLEEVLELSECNPEAIPSKMAVEDISIQIETIKKIHASISQLKLIEEKLENCMFSIADKAMVPALVIYNSCRNNERAYKLDKRASYQHFNIFHNNAS